MQFPSNGSITIGGTTPVMYSFVLFQGRFVAACYVKPKKFHQLTAWSQTVGGVMDRNDGKITRYG
jgi:hypothetical protein